MEKNKVIIYADRHMAETKVTAILKNRCEVREKKLNAADYVLSKEVACERKTGNDFLQSLIDGRLFAQVNELKGRYKNPILLIEGEIDLENRNIHPNAVRGALAAITIDLGMPVFWTKNQLETAETLFT
ncbi:MAG: DEAD/DEAH box helicase, partial [Candidatus Aenigmarchaeota archaeon]|nr:DEAD/DEAH box helicase [Candidatus Aenigmarchaeota archaeon]